MKKYKKYQNAHIKCGMNLFYLRDYFKFIYMGSLYIYNIKDIEMHLSCFMFHFWLTRHERIRMFKQL